VSLCHCRQCQKRTGSAFGLAAFFSREFVEAVGPTRIYSRQSQSGQQVTFRFCGECGSTVWWDTARLPDRIAVAVGAFADPGFPPPTQSVFGERRHLWVNGPIGPDG
jgi:hypothetical protein